MSAQENKAVVERMFEGLLNERRLELIDEVIAPDIVIHTPVPGVAPTREGFRQFIQVFLDAFPEQTVEVHDVVAEGDRVAVRHTHHVRHGGPFMGMPPTGRQASVDGIEIFRMAGGQIAEMWHQDDFLGLFQQLGMIPAPGAPQPEPAGEAA